MLSLCDELGFSYALARVIRAALVAHAGLVRVLQDSDDPLSICVK